MEWAYKNDRKNMDSESCVDFSFKDLKIIAQSLEKLDQKALLRVSSNANYNILIAR